MIKAIYSKPIANIGLNGGKIITILLSSGTGTGCLLFLYLINTVLEGITRAIKQMRASKGIKIGKETSKHCYLQVIW